MITPTTKLEELIHIERQAIPSDLCDYIIETIESDNWKPHEWTNTLSYENQGSEKDKGISGSAILSEILEKIKKYHIINIDICVITEEPKLKPYAAKIEESLSSLLHIDRNKINFKSKTNDGMGFIGRSEGIAVFANVLIKNK